MRTCNAFTISPRNMDRPLQQQRLNLPHLPGFRFRPTDEELFTHFLNPAANGSKFPFTAITTVDLYAYDPWELPELSIMASEREWHYFVVRDGTKQNGRRSNRIAKSGFWKATGSDRKVICKGSGTNSHISGLRKTLVYYMGKAPKGSKTNWVMKEYRLQEDRKFSLDIVLCKIYQKATSLKVLEQRASETSAAILTNLSTTPSTADTGSFSQGFPTFNFDLGTESVGESSFTNHINEVFSNIIVEQYDLARLRTDSDKDSLDSFLSNLQVGIPASMHQGVHSAVEPSSYVEHEYFSSPCMDLKIGAIDGDGRTSSSAATNQAIHSTNKNESSWKRFRDNLTELQLPNSSRNMIDPFLLYSPWMDSTSSADMLLENLGRNFSPTLFLG